MSGTLTTPESTGVGALLDANGQPYPISVVSSGAGGGLPAPGTPAYNPAWYALTAIFWDPAGTQGGSDANSGATLAAPVKTFAEIVRRYGSNQPTFNYGQSVTIDQLTAQPAGQDPVFFEPRVSGGGQAILSVLPVAFNAVATIAVNTAKVRGAPGTLLTLTLASCPAGVAVNMLAVNTTRNSQALVDSVGATVVMQQPQTIASLASTATVPAPVEDDTWATGDQVQFYTLQNTNLKRWRPVGGDETAAGQPSGGWVFTASIADPSGTGASVFLYGSAAACTALVNCVVNPRTHFSSESGRGNAPYSIGSSHVGQVVIFGGSPDIVGGALAGGLTVDSGAPGIANDAIVHGTCTINNGRLFVTKIYSDGAWTVLNSGMQVSAGGINWGSYSMSLAAGAVYTNNSGSTYALAALLTSGAITFGGATTGSVYNVAAGVGSFQAGVTLTPGNIDTGGTGGAGIQSPITGARFY